MEEKILFNVLKGISKSKSAFSFAPDDEYINALETIGMIKKGWNITLTSLGVATLDALRNKLEKW